MPHPRIGIVLLAHGSKDPAWREPVEQVAALIQTMNGAALVRCAYLELNPPDLPSAVKQLRLAGAAAAHVVPLFFGVGKHLRQDLPRLAQELRDANPGLPITVAKALGEDPQVLEWIARRALAGEAQRH